MSRAPLLNRWTRPDCYMGAEWPEYFVFLGQHRDSDSVSRSNFIEGLKALGGESDEAVLVVRESHWAVGWIEWIAIHQDNADALRLAEEMLVRIDQYPILDEMAWGQLEWDEAAEYWERMSVRERIGYLKDADESIFAARRSSLPDSDFIYEALTRP